LDVDDRIFENSESGLFYFYVKRQIFPAHNGHLCALKQASFLGFSPFQEGSFLEQTADIQIIATNRTDR
jgi:hypothetical protein